MGIASSRVGRKSFRVLTVTVVLAVAGAAVSACSADGAKPEPGASTPAPSTASTAPGSSGARTVAVFTPDRRLDEAELTRSGELLLGRAKARGLPDAQVAPVPGGLRLSVAGQVAADRLVALGRQAVLEFRPVLALAPGGTTQPVGGPDPLLTGTVPPDLASRFAALTCGASSAALTAPTDPGAALAVCGTVSKADPVAMKLALGPLAVRGVDVTKAAADFDSQYNRGWQVTLSFNPKGTTAFAEVTGKLAVQSDPANQIAILLDGTVVSHPAVIQSITGGEVVISGNYGEDEARDLAAVLTQGSLPATFQPSAATSAP
ncbi:hypothetical protein ACFVVX_35330 [Kitasatospora sp. NPDC058170]|uniref:SecDF P1 head subdomain-containing protein n=1 Tax=Kitasatospora sp. NPDC058170 TaxID=3346364 RepID=UPI0036DD844E